MVEADFVGTVGSFECAQIRMDFLAQRMCVRQRERPRGGAVTGRRSRPSPATEFPVPNAHTRAHTRTHVLPPSRSLSSFSLFLSLATVRNREIACDPARVASLR